jgi:soluble lytic murein transglycosylase-like protein
MEAIIAMIITIAVELGVPSNFALSVAVCESGLNSTVVSDVRKNGSIDRGLFQLNSYVYPDIDWSDPEVNARLGIVHLKRLIEMDCHNTYWAAAVSYNAGHYYMLNGLDPPESSIIFANRVMFKYSELSGGYVNPVIKKR